MVELKTFSKDEIETTDTFKRVSSIASELLAELNSPKTFRLILNANKPGISSAEIQNTFLPAFGVLSAPKSRLKFTESNSMF